MCDSGFSLVQSDYQLDLPIKFARPQIKKKRRAKSILTSQLSKVNILILNVKKITIGKLQRQPSSGTPARIIHELALRDCKDERTTGQPQGLESEAYLNSTLQGSRPEDARKDVHIHSRSSQFMDYPGQGSPSGIRSLTLYPFHKQKDHIR